MKTTIGILFLLGALAGGTAYYLKYMVDDSPASFRTAQIVRGDLIPTISATGIVQAEEVVDVGAQVIGRIKSFGIDPSDPAKKKTVDYGSTVHEGTVLALIDDATYRAQVDSAQATLQKTKADLLQYNARFDHAEREWKRAESLRPTKAISDTDFDLAVSNYKAARAGIAVGEAAIKQAEAALQLAKTNLDYTVIKSPVEGVIVARRVNVGQTVVASLNAPNLFLIAKDLRRIQVWAQVNEAHIGQIHVGMPVRFTVQTYPNEVFRGKVAQVRLNAQTTQNVITYTVVVVTDNLDGRLLPYLTADLLFEVECRPNVLQVPNQALRWKPRPEHIAPDARETAASATPASADVPKASSPGDTTSPGRSGKAVGSAKANKPQKAREEQKLWVPFEGFVRPLTVQVGITDGTMTEVSGHGVEEGMEVVIGVNRKEERTMDSGGSSPLMPQPFRRGQRPKM